MNTAATPPEQLQLDLWDWLEEAAQVVEYLPELIAVTDGITALDGVLATLSQQPVLDQLGIAATALDQLSTLLERKSHEWLSAWEQDDSGMSGVELSSDWSAGLVRQPPSFDLSALVEVPPPPLKPKRIRPTKDSSIAAEVDPERILEMLIQMSQSPDAVQQQLFDLAGSESPTEWAERIATCLSQNLADSPTISFAQLQQATQLSPSELWLGLLLGGYILQPPLPADPGSGLDPGRQFYQLPGTLQIQCASPADYPNRSKLRGMHSLF